MMETGTERLEFKFIEFDLDWIHPQKANLISLRGKQSFQKNYKQLSNSTNYNNRSKRR